MNDLGRKLVRDAELARAGNDKLPEMVDKAASYQQLEARGISRFPDGDANLVKMGSSGLINMKGIGVKVHRAALGKQIPCR